MEGTMPTTRYNNNGSQEPMRPLSQGSMVQGVAPPSQPLRTSSTKNPYVQVEDASAWSTPYPQVIPEEPIATPYNPSAVKEANVPSAMWGGTGSSTIESQVQQAQQQTQVLQSANIQKQQEQEALEEAALKKQIADGQEVQKGIADRPLDYLQDRNLMNTHISEEIYEMEEYTDLQGNQAKRPRVDPLTGEPVLKSHLQANPVEASRIVADPASQAVAGTSAATDASVASQGEAAYSDTTFSDASSAQAYLAEVSQGSSVSANEHAAVQAAQEVVARDFEASLIPLSEIGQSLEKLRDVEPMQASSVASHMNGLISEMESGNVPLWARPAVTQVEQSLASRGINASSVGRDSLFNAIIGAAMPMAQADAASEQDANKTNYNSKVQALFNDEAQIFAAKQFNATSINQTNQFMSNLQAQVDLQNAARKDNMSQFNSSQRNQLSMFNTQQLNDMTKLNTSEANATARANSQLNTNVSLSNADRDTQVAMANTEAANRAALANADRTTQVSMANAEAANRVELANADAANRMSLANADRATQVALSNAQLATQMAQHQSSLDSQREQFNAQNANAIAQADVAWRRNLNTAETAAINAAHQANVANAFGLSTQAQQNLWQEVRDEAHWAMTASENELSRKHEGAMRILVADIEAGVAEGMANANSPWNRFKDSLTTAGIDEAVNWLLG